MLTINNSADLIAILTSWFINSSTPFVSSLRHVHISRLSWNFKIGIIKLLLSNGWMMSMMEIWKWEISAFVCLSSWPCFSQSWWQLKCSHVSSSILSKKEGNLPSSKNHWALLMHRTHPKNFQGLHNNLARYYLFSPSIQKPYHVPVFLQFNCNNQMRHELNQTKRWVFQLHQSKGKKVRLIWDDRCWMADWLHR